MWRALHTWCEQQGAARAFVHGAAGMTAHVSAYLISVLWTGRRFASSR